METDPEEHRLNYERYRTLVMIDYSGGQSVNYLLPLSMLHNDINDSPLRPSISKLEVWFSRRTDMQLAVSTEKVSMI